MNSTGASPHDFAIELSSPLVHFADYFTNTILLTKVRHMTDTTSLRPSADAVTEQDSLLSRSPGGSVTGPPVNSPANDCKQPVTGTRNSGKWIVASGDHPCSSPMHWAFAYPSGTSEFPSPSRRLICFRASSGDKLDFYSRHDYCQYVCVECGKHAYFD